MKSTEDILEKVNRRDGLTVPEGFFADFNARMAASLPEREWEHEAPAIEAPRSFWSKIRPYVYMAAMFMGVWLMMQMFNMISSSSRPDLSLDSNPVLAAAVSDDSFMSDYYLDTFNDYDLTNQMIENGTIEDFLNEGVN
ncbi:MAG: hypothetical protein J1E63_07200 [Muribaculaceae bacterium]|nr:hypothetical protein [Muribaculaceae bacterium]